MGEDGSFYREGKEGWKRVGPGRVRVGEDTVSILAEKERKARKKKKYVWCSVGGRMGTRMGQGWFKVCPVFVSGAGKIRE